MRWICCSQVQQAPSLQLFSTHDESLRRSPDDFSEQLDNLRRSFAVVIQEGNQEAAVLPSSSPPAHLQDDPPR